MLCACFYLAPLFDFVGGDSGGVVMSAGMAIGSVLSPAIANSADDIRQMLLIMAAPAAAGALVTTFALQDKPPTPPTLSALEKTDSFMVSVALVLSWVRLD